MVQRDGLVYAQVVRNTSAKILAKVIRRHVAKSALIITDAYPAYRWLKTEYRHVAINHKKGEFSDGVYHTNTIEGFWGLLRKGLAGTYHQVVRKHLHVYVNEFLYRYNHRHLSAKEKFDDVLKKAMETRMNYDTLIGRGKLRQLHPEKVSIAA